MTKKVLMFFLSYIHITAINTYTVFLDKYNTQVYDINNFK